jgi:hypothetical protein
MLLAKFQRKELRDRNREARDQLRMQEQAQLNEAIYKRERLKTVAAGLCLTAHFPGGEAYIQSVRHLGRGVSGPRRHIVVPSLANQILAVPTRCT